MRIKAREPGKRQIRNSCELSQRDVSVRKSNKEALWKVKPSNDEIRCLFQKDCHLTALGRMDCRDQGKKLRDPLEDCGSNQGKKLYKSELS